MQKVGVVLFQLGGPDSIEAIEPFLFNLFSDPDIIDFPLARLGRKPLARLIASRRARHVAHHYTEIGGKSPILEFTVRQARALEAELRRDFDVSVAIAMRYSNPLAPAAIDQVKAFGAETIVLLPLYPQYSRTTTGSSVREWNRRLEKNGWRPDVRLIRDYHDDAGYIGALASAIGRSLAAFSDPALVDLVFSAHSVPVDVIAGGDPYQRQIERTVELLIARGGWKVRSARLCYQSKVGPSRWLRPMMRETLEELASGGSRHVLIAPVSFVSDHVETLHEIDIEHREIALRLGIEEFRMVPGLNDAPEFIAALAGLVRRSVAG